MPYNGQFETTIYDSKKTRILEKNVIHGINVNISVSLSHMMAVLKRLYIEVWKRAFDVVSKRQYMTLKKRPFMESMLP